MGDVKSTGGRHMSEAQTSAGARSTAFGSQERLAGSRGRAPARWWLAADGKWYPPLESLGAPGHGGSGIADGATKLTDQPGAGWWLASDDKWYAPNFLISVVPTGAVDEQAQRRLSAPDGVDAVTAATRRARRPTKSPASGSALGAGSWYAAMEGATRAGAPVPERPSPGDRPAAAWPDAPPPPPAGPATVPPEQVRAAAGQPTNEPEENGVPGIAGSDSPGPRTPPAGAPVHRGSASEWDFIPSVQLAHDAPPTRRTKFAGRLRRSKPKSDASGEDESESPEEP